MQREQLIRRASVSLSQFNQGIEVKKLPTYTLAVALLLSTTASLAQQKMDDMKGMEMGNKPAATTQAAHTAVATVKRIDPKARTVTLAHEPVKSLNWPAMTMGFKVADNVLLDKLAEGKKVVVEFKKVGDAYVVTSVR